MTSGATAIRIQEYMAALVLHHDSPMDTAITAGTTAAISGRHLVTYAETRRP
jgi:hypothetical protein